MSSDAFGSPVRKYDFAKPIGASGQALQTGATPHMPTYMVWSRTDQLTCVAGTNPYIVFDVPPLPVGSVIRATVAAVLGATDNVFISRASDWLSGASTPPGFTGIAGFTSTPGVTMTFTICGFVRGRNSIIFADEGAGAITTITAVDWGMSQRLGISGGENTAVVMHGALVEVFIPSIYQ